MSKQRDPWFCQDCRIMMLYNDKEDYHICPKCKARVYHADEKDEYLNDEIRSLMKDMAHTHKPREALPAGGALPGGGGSKSKGRSRKSDMKKKSLAQLNMGLAGTYSAFNS